MKNHIMVDLETLGVGANAVFLSIAAVQFDLESGETGELFNENIHLQSAQDLGLEIEGDTLKWWLMQRPQALQLMFGNPSDIASVLTRFAIFMDSFKDARIWGNSARFDMGKLVNAYNKLRFPLPWDPKKEMCYRTLKNLFPNVPPPASRAGHHDPLQDCYYQIEHLVAIHKFMQQDGSKYKDSEFETDYGLALALLHEIKEDETPNEIGIATRVRIGKFLFNCKPLPK
jgi:hypothetical protein